MHKQLDIGCGTILRKHKGADECYGVDIVPSLNAKVFQADLALEPIPFKDNTFDLVTAYDFLEHIPMSIYYRDEKRNCMIELFNEVYRVLKDNGIFLVQVPYYPNLAVFQDPTHVSVWTTETVNYFSGDYYGFHDHYGHTSKFAKSVVLTGKPFPSHMKFCLVALKPCKPPYVV